MFSFLWPEIRRGWKTRFWSRTNSQTEDDYSVTNFLYCFLKYRTASHTTTELYAYHLLPGYRCIPWIPLCRYSQHLHIHRNDQNVFYCPLAYHSQQSADVRSSVKRMCTHSITMPKTCPSAVSFSSFLISPWLLNFPLINVHLRWMHFNYNGRKRYSSKLRRTLKLKW